jgi:hypothetical protein
MIGKTGDLEISPPAFRSLTEPSEIVLTSDQWLAAERDFYARVFDIHPLSMDEWEMNSSGFYIVKNDQVELQTFRKKRNGSLFRWAIEEPLGTEKAAIAVLLGYRRDVLPIITTIDDHPKSQRKFLRAMCIASYYA